MRSTRRGVQALSLLLFIALLAATTWPLRSPLSPQLFLRADPLAALCLLRFCSLSWLTLFWPALVLVAATALLGRFSCGWLCPLGTCLDLTDRLLAPLRRRLARREPLSPPAPPEGLRRVRYVVLALALAAGLAGGQLLWPADPLILLTRVAAFAAFPAAGQVYNAALPPAQPLLRAAALHWQPAELHLVRLAALTWIAFALILGLGLLSRRYWCRTLCPLGALLGLAGHRGLWRRRVSESCTACSRCVRGCKTGAISAAAPRFNAQSDCLQCYDCVGLCPPRATSLTLAARAAPAALPDFGRRRFLVAAAAGAAYGAAAHAGLPLAPAGKPLRPPGALLRDGTGRYTGPMPDDSFLSKCLRCGQCVKACPTGALQPAVVEAGLLGFCTPILDPSQGWCEQSCAACGAVCPGGALLPFSLQEKSLIRIGEAGIDRRLCLAWGHGDSQRLCLVCDEHCSYGAIRKLEFEGRVRPLVDTGRCTGCGQCQHACPARPGPAIVVQARPRR